MIGIAACCARAASGHAAPELAIALMKSRRFTCMRLHGRNEWLNCRHHNGAALHRRQPLCLQPPLPENTQPKIIWRSCQPTNTSA